MIKIESLRVYPHVTQKQMADHLSDLAKNDRKDLLLFADPMDSMQYIGVLLAKYYTPELSETVTVRETVPSGEFQQIYVSRGGVRTFINAVLRKMQYSAPENVRRGLEQSSAATQQKEQISQIPFFNEESPGMTVMEFLKTTTPLQIEQELNGQIIGQPALTRAVADFLYYHALRQLHPELPQRPLMVSGPSGNGKTEVWRAATRLYGKLFPIKIIDGSNISCDGWSGSNKVSNYVDATTAMSGSILVVDEFDKLVKPKHNSKGDNVSLDVQAEFLKLIEGEYQILRDKKPTGITSKKMGFVLVGAFEALREEKTRQHAQAPRIGFCSERSKLSVHARDEFSDEDFIRYGIMPEIVGRIAAKCKVAELSEKAYLEIIRNPNSRVSQIEKVLKQYGVQIADVLSDEELHTLISTSKSNRTGVRWVSAQVEGRLLETLRGEGLGLSQAS